MENREKGQLDETLTQFQFFTSQNGDYGSQDRLQAPYTSVRFVSAAVCGVSVLLFVCIRLLEVVSIIEIIVSYALDPLSRGCS